MVHGKAITVHTKGFSDIRDITADVKEIIRESGIKSGIAVVFASGS